LQHFVKMSTAVEWAPTIKIHKTGIVALWCCESASARQSGTAFCSSSRSNDSGRAIADVATMTSTWMSNNTVQWSRSFVRVDIRHAPCQHTRLASPSTPLRHQFTTTRSAFPMLHELYSSQSHLYYKWSERQRYFVSFRVTCYSLSIHLYNMIVFTP